MKNENGRSMVEMLGVLAIIGILSVAGIYGYTMAMRKYRANEIVHTASMLAIISQSVHGGDGACVTLSSAGLPDIPDVQMKADPEILPPTINIRIERDDNEELCTMIRNSVSEQGFQVDECSAGADVACEE